MQFIASVSFQHCEPETSLPRRHSQLRRLLERPVVSSPQDGVLAFRNHLAAAPPVLKIFGGWEPSNIGSAFAPAEMKGAASFQINLGLVRSVGKVQLRMIRHFADLPRGGQLTTIKSLKQLMEGSEQFGVEWGTLRAQTEIAKVALHMLFEQRLGGLSWVCKTVLRVPAKKTKADQLAEMSWPPESVIRAKMAVLDSAPENITESKSAYREWFTIQLGRTGSAIVGCSLGIGVSSCRSSP